MSKISGNISTLSTISGDIAHSNNVDGRIEKADGHGVDDYEKLKNKPKIEGVELVGDLTLAQLHHPRITNSELEALLQL